MSKVSEIFDVKAGRLTSSTSNGPLTPDVTQYYVRSFPPVITHVTPHLKFTTDINTSEDVI